MPVYTVQQQVSTVNPFGPAVGKHEMREDLIGMHMVLQRGGRPTVKILDVIEAKDGIRCFARITTGPAQGSTAFLPFDLLEPDV